jgi:ribosomal protein S18 acetylase RimI-like enzyme
VGNIFARKDLIMKISKATQSYSKRIADLVNSAYRGDSGRQGWTTEADIIDGTRTSPELISDLIQSENTQVLIALEHDLIIGCVELKINPDASAYIGMLTVNPSLQNSGIGARLLSTVLFVRRFRSPSTL